MQYTMLVRDFVEMLKLLKFCNSDHVDALYHHAIDCRAEKII